MGTESLPEPTPAGRRRPELEPRCGMRLGRYELLAPLASGGMARVWIARLAGEHGFERLAAIKTMRPEHVDNDAFRRMFLDEAKLAARIAHSNVVQVLDLGEEQGIVYQAMALVEGESIAELLKRRKKLGTRGLPPGVAARIISDVLCGLHAAHELTDEDGRSLNLVHRDVSPQNVLVSVDGVAKIADFGIAKARLRLADETEAGQVKGKFAYMAPEQIERRAVDRRADVFSTGVVLWEAWTGKRLFGGIDLLDTIAMVRESNIPDPRTVLPALPAQLAEVTMRALERDPSVRFATAAEMSDALDRAAASCGMTASTKEVGALVADLCADELTLRKNSVRDAVRAVTGNRVDPAEAATHVMQTASGTTTVVDADGPEPARRGVLRRAVIAIAAAAVVGGVVVMARHRPESAPVQAVSATPGSASASASAPASAPAPAPASASALSPALAPTTVQPSASTPPGRVRRPPSPAGPRIKYGNPYGP